MLQNIYTCENLHVAPQVCAEEVHQGKQLSQTRLLNSLEFLGSACCHWTHFTRSGVSPSRWSLGAEIMKKCIHQCHVIKPALINPFLFCLIIVPPFYLSATFLPLHNIMYIILYKNIIFIQLKSLNKIYESTCIFVIQMFHKVTWLPTVTDCYAIQSNLQLQQSLLSNKFF